ncbi:hypothetical protein ACZ75_03385 [Massilia sp. NR 4-1]|nr:hypothetical protein ACZ75_03385 [Massilia sp. NR 4-1]
MLSTNTDCTFNAAKLSEYIKAQYSVFITLTIQLVKAILQQRKSIGAASRCIAEYIVQIRTAYKIDLIGEVSSFGR